MDMNIVYGLDGDLTVPVVAVAPDTADVAAGVINMVGVGNPFLVYGALAFSTANGVEWDHEGAPLVNADAKVNQTAINAMLASPDYSKVWAL